MKKSKIASLSIAFALLLTGCIGGKGKDNPTPPTPPVVENDGSLEKPFTVADVIKECDEAGANIVVGTECYVTGTFENGTTIDSYGRWSGVAKMDGKELKLESLTVPSTMNIAPENGRLDGKKFIVKGYAELYNGNYVIGYLNATVSPTGSKYNPTIYSIEGKTDYANTDGYKPAADKFIEKFVSGSNVSFPALPEAQYEGAIDINHWGPGFTLSLTCTDNANPGDATSFEEVYKAKIDAADWDCTNDEDYTYDEYGYLYEDATKSYAIQFYTYGGKFALEITDLKANYKEGKSYTLGSDEGENWYNYYVEEYDYTYSEAMPVASIAALCGIPEEKVPTFDIPYGCVFTVDEGDEENAPYVEVDLFGWDVEAGYDWMLGNCTTTYSIYGDLNCYPEDRSCFFQFFESYNDDFGYCLYFYNIEDFCCLDKTENTAWTAEDIEAMSAALGSENILPFVQLGEDYSFANYDGTFYLYDYYAWDLTETVFTALLSAGYEKVSEYDETSEQYYDYYVKTCTDGTEISISGSWDGGNFFVIGVKKPASEIVLSQEEVSIKQGKTYQIEYEFGPTGCIEPEETVTFSSDNPKVSVNENGLVTVAEDATVGDTAYITVTCGTLTAKLLVTVLEAGGSSGEEGWSKVTSTSSLSAGDTILFACESCKTINGVKGTNNKAVMSVAATFSDGKITSTVDPSSYITLGGTSGAWTFTLDGLTLASSGKTSMYNGTCSTWKIDIAANGNATIKPTAFAGVSLFYNPSSPRFTTYENASDTAVEIQLYKLA